MVFENTWFAHPSMSVSIWFQASSLSCRGFLEIWVNFGLFWGFVPLVEPRTMLHLEFRAECELRLTRYKRFLAHFLSLKSFDCLDVMLKWFSGADKIVKYSVEWGLLACVSPLMAPRFFLPKIPFPALSMHCVAK